MTIHIAVPHYKAFDKRYRLYDRGGVFGPPSCLVGSFEYICLTNDEKLLFTTPKLRDTPGSVYTVDLERMYLSPANFDRYFENYGEDGLWQWHRDYSAQKLREENLAAWSGVFHRSGSDGSTLYIVLLQKDGSMFLVHAYGKADYIWDGGEKVSLLMCGRLSKDDDASEFYKLIDGIRFQWGEQ